MTSGAPARRVVATAGHVDHGKSTLILALTGTNPDRFAEEQRRGLTIDLGFAHLDLPSGARVGFVDVPGHVRFLRNMLAGVGTVDACLFVVAATEGWKPQSEEHLRILEMLGIRHGVVALTKSDLVDDDWLTLQSLEVVDRLAGSFLADAPVIPVSATTGAGLGLLIDSLDALVASTPAPVDRGRPRLWIDRSFAARGSGTVVTGTLTGGSFTVDDHVDVVPSGPAVRIRSLQSYGRSADVVGPGVRVALNLAGIDHHDVRRGDAVVHASQWRPSQRIDVELEVVRTLDHEVTRRGAYVAYIGSGEWPVRLRLLATDAVHPGGTAAARMHLATALPLVLGDRFVLRESGRGETVGGGRVLDVDPVLPASRATPDDDIDRVVRERGWTTAADLEALTGQHREPTVGGWVVAPAEIATRSVDLRRRIAEAGSIGLDVATLDDRERVLVGTLDDIRVSGGRATHATARDDLLDHPVLESLRLQGCAPEPPAGINKASLRELVRRRLLIERDGIYFHPDAIVIATDAIRRLLDQHPDGITMSQLRDALGVSRKFALPLANELDSRGVTRRRDDLRIAGPRLADG